MAKIQRSIQKQDLQGKRVLIDDTDPSSRYFRVKEVTDVLHSGRQGFLLEGSPELVNDTEVLIELLDVNGDTVFVSTVRNYAEGRARFISIEVYEDTPPGPATLTILGEAAVIADTGESIPDVWRKVFNVKWQKQLSIEPLRTNDSKIRVFQIPELTVQEILAPFRKTVTSSLQQVTGSGTPANANTALQNTSVGIPNVYTVISNGTPISKSMEGGSFTASLSFSPGGSGSAPGVAFGTVFTTSIVSVLNDSQFQVSPSLKSDDGTRYAAFSDVGNYTISFQDTPSFTNTALTRSFADVQLLKLKTFSGDIARTKFFVRAGDSEGDFELVGDVRLEELELTTTNSIALGPKAKMGNFFSQDVIDEFWVGGFISQSTNPPYSPGGAITVIKNTSNLIDSMHISVPDLTIASTAVLSGSTAIPRVFMGLTGSAANDITLNFIRTLEYTLRGDFLCSKANDGFEGKMEVYLSGSAFPSTSSFGRLITTLTSPVGEIRNLQRDVTINFVPSSDGTAKLYFVVYEGDWYISDVSVKSSLEAGFNPECASFIIPVFNKRFEQLQFKAQLFDPNNNEFPQEILSDFVFFDGGNILLRGSDHRVEGTLTISPSGSGITLTSEGYLDEDGSPLSGSAIFLGQGRFFHSGTAILMAEEPDGDPRLSMGDKLKAFIDPVTGEFILQIVGTILVGSGSSFTDIRSLLPRKPTDEFFHRIKGINLDFFDLQGKKAITAGNVQSDTDANFVNSEQIARMGKYTRGTSPREVPAISPLIVSGVTGSLNPFSSPTVTVTISGSGTIDVPSDIVIWNNSLYGNMTVDVDEVLLVAGDGAYQVDFELTVDTSWVGFASGSNPGLPSDDLNTTGTRVVQTITLDNDFYITQTGSFSPDPFISYPIHIPEERPNGFDTLYVVVNFQITTNQA